MEEVTTTEAVAEFAGHVLEGTGWELVQVRKRASRLEPPHAYWSIFEVAIKKDEEERRLRLVARGTFDTDTWGELREKLMSAGHGFPCDPINSIGYPVIFDGTQHAYWFFPFDLELPGLPYACDAETMWRVLTGLNGRTLGGRLVINRLHVERVRYTPEISAILRYELEGPGGEESAIYGKVQPGGRGLRTHRLVETLWRVASESDGLLRIPRPVAFVREYGLLLESAVPGDPVKGERTSREFRGVGRAAAEAVAVIHESGLTPDERIHIEAELERLDSVTEQFAYVNPKAHFLLAELLTHLRDRLERTNDEELVPTHADLKYDQFIHEDGRYTLIDFDYCAIAETSYDLAKFCAYLVPSAPTDWEDTVAAEATRSDFLRRYLELRPHATLDRFQIYEALILALRAMTMMWAQHRGWQQASEVFLVMAQERLRSRLPD
jgi:hypothetical protein